MLQTHRIILCAAVVLASGFGVLALADNAAEEAKAAIQKLAGDAGTKDWEALSKAGAEVAKKNELEDVMNLFKLRKPGKVAGLGVGKDPGQITPDGIEAKILDLGKKGAGPAEDRGALIRMAEVTAAIAATSVHQCPSDAKMGKKDPAQWKAWSKELYGSSQDLVKALKANNNNEVKKVATKLRSICNDCHDIWR